MLKYTAIFFIYALALLVSHIYALDLGINKDDFIYDVNMNMEIIEKNKKITLNWAPMTNEDPHPQTFTVELLTNITIDKVTGNLYCAGTYPIANNITEYEFKWKVIKLQKYDLYNFLITANGYNKYGLTKTVYYAPDLYKFIKKKKGNSKLIIPYEYDENEYTLKNVVGSSLNVDLPAPANNSPVQEAPKPIEADVSSPPAPIQTIPDNSGGSLAIPSGNPTDNTSSSLPIVDNNTIVNGNNTVLDNSSSLDNNSNNNIRTKDREGKISLYNIRDGKSKIPLTLLVGLVMAIGTATVLLVLAVFLHQKNKKNGKSSDSAISLDKWKTSTLSFSEGYTQDFNFENKSESDNSELVRERLKQEALKIERKKVLESISEKKLTSSSSSSNYNTGNNTSDLISNPLSNVTTDYSWQGMEVLTFTPKKVVNEKQRKIHDIAAHKKTESRDVNFNGQNDVDQKADQKVDHIIDIGIDPYAVIGEKKY